MSAQGRSPGAIHVMKQAWGSGHIFCSGAVFGFRGLDKKTRLLANVHNVHRFAAGRRQTACKGRPSNR